MMQNNLIIILTAAELLAANLVELLQMDGFCCHASNDLSQMLALVHERQPMALVLDELNNKGCYEQFLKMHPADKDPRIIILSGDGDKTNFPGAYSCVGMPFGIDGLSTILSAPWH